MIVITTKREVKCNHLYYVLKEENVDSRNMVVSSKTNKKSKKKKTRKLGREKFGRIYLQHSPT